MEFSGLLHQPICISLNYGKLRCKRMGDPGSITTTAYPHPLLNRHALKCHLINLLLETLYFWMNDAIDFRKVRVETIGVTC